MERAGAVEFPGEVHADRAGGCLHLLEMRLLLFPFEFVFRGHQVDGHFLVRSLVFDHGLEKFHKVADLVKQADVRIGDRDHGCALEIGTEQRIEGEALLVFLEGEVSFGKRGDRGKRGGGGRFARTLVARGSWLITGYGLVVRTGVFLFLQGADQLFLSLVPGLLPSGEIRKAHFAVGGIDAHQLVFDALAPFNGKPQQFLDILPGCAAMREENLHQAGKGLVDPVAIPGRNIGGKGEMLPVAVRVIMIAQ